MTKFQNILALDTSMAGCSAAVFSVGRAEGFVLSEDLPRGQSERLMPMVVEVMEAAGLSFDALDAVLVTLGPGAFTGLRVGLSTAKALGLSLGFPVYGVSSLQALAFDVVARGRGDNGFRVLIEPRRDDFYVQDFDCAGEALSDPVLLGFDDILSTLAPSMLLLGDAVERFEGLAFEPLICVVDKGFQYPDPLVMAQEFSRDISCYTNEIEPLYLRGADVSLSKKVYRVMS